MDSVVQQKTRDYAIRIINCYTFLTEQKHEKVMSKQLLRCGTSIGANIRESRHAQSDADFLSKMSIAFKEADEVTEQRAQNQTCLSYVESRRNSTIVNLNTGSTYYTKRNTLMMLRSNHSITIVRR